jgi:hypothetical protein
MPESATTTRGRPGEQKNSWRLDELPAAVLLISSLLLDDSPRHGGENDEHVHALTESEEQLPPIIVHSPSMRVIDGRHRIRAAIIRGEDKIDAKIYHGTDDDAFVLAVRMNITHGLPLTRAERTAAALRIIGSHPQWSNRMIATATGLSAATIATQRQRSTAQNAQSTTRIGKDGRTRPLNTTAARHKTEALLAEQPTASIRAIAAQAGVSHSTVHDVRQRLRTNQDPTPHHQKTHKTPEPPRTPAISPPPSTPGNPGPTSSTQVSTILATLKADPSLRHTDTGRALLQCLNRYHVQTTQSPTITDMVPDHCTKSVATLARNYAQVWTMIATLLEQRGN